MIFISPSIPNIILFINSVMKYMLINIIIRFDIKYIISSSRYFFDFNFFVIIILVSRGSSVNAINQINVIFILSLNVCIIALVLYCDAWNEIRKFRITNIIPHVCFFNIRFDIFIFSSFFISGF